ncbi:phenylacetate--CoA ligase family protein [Luteimonas sp. A534]
MTLIMRYTPFWLQNLAVTVYNGRLYRQRRAGMYPKWRNYYESIEGKPACWVEKEASKRLADFLAFVSEHSTWYRDCKATDLDSFPILEKTKLLEGLDRIATVKPEEALVSHTGGTTGASMKVYYTLDDMQERFALLDHFRGTYGYKLGKRVAWFSGKSLATQRDVEKGHCYRDDLINKIRFFSTFHISKKNFDHYWEALEKFKPRYMIGFPSSIYDIAVVARERGLKASYEVQAVFPTAETVLPMHREVIGAVFNTRLIDQYASSEGAPFILECPHGRLHIHPLSGVFEVIDSEGNPAPEGEILVTSFTTHGTPLVRYRIGDRIKLSDSGSTCVCGSVFPMVDWIDGRTSDFIWSPENGRINLGNLSNSTKDVDGIHCFQVIQDDPSRIEVHVVGSTDFDDKQEQAFLAALRARIGNAMEVHLRRVDEIPREKSGKFRIVKNSIAGSVPA